NGPAAMEAMARGTMRPDLILADYNLPNGMNGVQVSQKLRQGLDRRIPFIILTGDISTETLRDIALHDCVHLHKPVKLNDLTRAIEKLLAKPPDPLVPPPHHAHEGPSASGGGAIIVVDDDDLVCEAIRTVLEDDGRAVEVYASCEAFLKAFDPDKSACLLIDAYLPGMSGLELLEKLHHDGHRLPAIIITGNSDVPMAIQAMKAGALDFIEKPIGREGLIAGIGPRTVARFEQAAGAARIGGGSPRGSHAATTRRDGKGAGRPAQQEHRIRSRHQPAHGREPPRFDYEENRVEVAARAGQVGASGFGRRRGAVNFALRSRAACAFNPREYGRRPPAAERDHTRSWSSPELAPKESRQGRPTAKTRTRARERQGPD